MDTYEVVGIAQNAFFSDDLETLTIGEGIETIAQGAISSQSLKLLQIPNSVRYLDFIWTTGADVKFGNNKMTEFKYIKESFPICNSEKLIVVGKDCDINHSFLS